MKQLDIRHFIRTDRYNLLRDGDNKILYFLRKLWYKIILRKVK